MKVYHFIGIGGVSMSALARILFEDGNVITGSDINPNTKLDFATVFHNHDAQNVKPADVVVYNNAIQSTNPEILSARKLGKEVISRANLLAKISSGYKNVIAISGMHGKTTTTEMIAEVFLRAGKNPTVHIGAISNYFNSNLRVGEKGYFITEACEYGDSFLSLKPTLSVVLNIEPEHLDYFKNFSNIKKSFQIFSNQSKNVVIHNNYKNLIKTKNKNKYKINKKTNKTKVFCDNYCVYAKNIKKIKNKLSYDLYYKNKFKGKVILNSIVEKNVENSLACFLVCKHFHIDERYFFAAMRKFKGTKRRMEVLSLNPLVIEDYAHHPSELKTVIESVQKHYLEDNLNKKLIVIFQPHTYTRTRAFFGDFIEVLLKADFVGILETFSARENIIQGASGFDLYKALKTKFTSSEKKAMYFQNIYEVKNYISSPPKNSIVLYLGAGESLANIFN